MVRLEGDWGSSPPHWSAKCSPAVRQSTQIQFMSANAEPSARAIARDQGSARPAIQSPDHDDRAGLDVATPSARQRLTVWFNERVGNLKPPAADRHLAMARKLLVALWRYLETGLVPTGASEGLGISP